MAWATKSLFVNFIPRIPLSLAWYDHCLPYLSISANKVDMGRCHPNPAWYGKTHTLRRLANRSLSQQLARYSPRTNPVIEIRNTTLEGANTFPNPWGRYPTPTVGKGGLECCVELPDHFDNGRYANLA